MRPTLPLALVGSLLAASLSASPALAAQTVVVGSKIDTEGSLLCPMIRLALEARKIPVREKCGTGATQVVRKALLEGEIDLYPEYTGNAPYLIKDAPFAPDTFRSMRSGFAAAAKADLERNRIVWLAPAPANNTWTIALPKRLADSQKLRSMADLSAYLKAGKPLRLVASQEFVDRDDALKAFETTYGFKLKPEQRIILPGGNTAQTEAAAAQGTSGANAAMAYGTDGQLSALGLVALADPKGAVVVYNPAVTVREATYKAYPAIRAALEPVFASLDGATLSRLNAQIVVGGQPPAKVAEQYLRQRGLLK